MISVIINFVFYHKWGIVSVYTFRASAGRQLVDPPAGGLLS